jgi:hypothetical protein
MKRWIESGLVMLVAAGSVLGAGCGDDTERKKASGPIEIAIKNGTWMISETVSFLGADSCLARGDTTVDSTGVICDVTVGSTSFPAEVNCTLESSATSDSVWYTCTFTTDLGFCIHTITLTGEGTVDSTSFSLVNLAYTKVRAKDSEDQNLCDLYYLQTVDPCTTLIHFDGTWISSEGDSLCPPEEGAPSVPIQLLIHDMAGRVRGE